MVKFGGKIGTLYQIFTPCTPCKIGQMFKQKGGGAKGLLNNVKKTALFLPDGFPYHDEKYNNLWRKGSLSRKKILLGIAQIDLILKEISTRIGLL